MQASTVRPLDDLPALSAAADVPLRLRQRATIIGLVARGWSVPDIARAVGVSPHTVTVWSARYAAQGSAGLADLLPPVARQVARLADDNTAVSTAARVARVPGAR